jgi:murein L,D-transpeptidase YafK
MKLIVDGQDVKTYLFGLGGNPDKPKTRRGDSATPEGEYYVCQKLPNSRFYLSLKLAYPNATDAERGVSRGLIDSRTCEKIKSAVESRRVPPMNTRLGGDICIHGGGAGKIDWSGGAPTMKVRDWTAGCIALENRQMKELFEFIPVGTVVRITA